MYFDGITESNIAHIESSQSAESVYSEWLRGGVGAQKSDKRKLFFYSYLIVLFCY